MREVSHGPVAVSEGHPFTWGDTFKPCCSPLVLLLCFVARGDGQIALPPTQHRGPSTEREMREDAEHDGGAG